MVSVDCHSSCFLLVDIWVSVLYDNYVLKYTKVLYNTVFQSSIKRDFWRGFGEWGRQLSPLVLRPYSHFRLMMFACVSVTAPADFWLASLNQSSLLWIQSSICRISVNGYTQRNMDTEFFMSRSLVYGYGAFQIGSIRITEGLMYYDNLVLCDSFYRHKWNCDWVRS